MTAAIAANLERLGFSDDGCTGMIPGPRLQNTLLDLDALLVVLYNHSYWGHLS